MKKIIVLVVLSLIAINANAQFFWGIQGGVYTDGATVSNPQGTTKGATNFSYVLKPSIGYYFTPRFAMGVKFVWQDSRYMSGENYSNANFIRYVYENALMGAGINRNAASFKVMPYARYKITHVLTEKLNIWAELNAYYGFGKSRDPQNGYKFEENKVKSTYGVGLHPMISYDLTDKFMVFTTLEVASLGWDGSTTRTAILGTNGDPTGQYQYNREGAFYGLFNPINGIVRAFFNIGVCKRF